MEKRNVAEPKRTPCAFCGRPSVTFVGDRPSCSIHVKLLKEGSNETPLKDAGPSLTKEWAK
jgi:hypothetical protein